QPAPIVAGLDGNHDVPISIVARDEAVLDQISDWGWESGLKPDPRAPVWRMDAFRDRVLRADGPPSPTRMPKPINCYISTAVARLSARPPRLRSRALAVMAATALVAAAATPAAAAPVPADGLTVIAVKHSILGTHTWYQQTLHGIPVLGGFYATHS